ncbi:MAG TPA: amidohydrolase, partial [Sphingomicrobium sp.]
MRRYILASLLAAAAAVVPASSRAHDAPAPQAAPITKEQLMAPPAGARHFTISSAAAKHGDVWSWPMPDGSIAYRMSMSLRGWITETDQVMTMGADGRPVRTVIRGFTDSGDASEEFSVDASG